MQTSTTFNLQKPACQLLKSYRAVLYGFLLLFSGGLSAQLSGTYTVCLTGCDYDKIQDAADDLKSKGISASVTIEIKSGTYNEAITIDSISGVSATKTVKFIGAGGKNTDVKIYYSSGITLNLNSTARITFENVSIETRYYNSGVHAVKISSSSNIVFTNCFVTAYTGGYIYDHNLINIRRSKDIAVRNSYLRGGGDAAIGDGSNGLNTRVRIEDNLITKFYHYGIFSSYSESLSCVNNIIDSSILSSSGGYGIYIYNGYGTNLIKGNTTNKLNFIYSSTSYATDIIDSNHISGGYNGIFLSGGPTSKAIVANNRLRNVENYSLWVRHGSIQVSNNMIDVNLTGTAAMMYIYPAAATGGSCLVSHNTVLSSSHSGYALYLWNTNSCESIEVTNNLIQGTAIPYYLSGLISGNKVDGNNVYRTTSGTYSVINGTSSTTFSATVTTLKSAIGSGDNESNAQVSFANAPSDIHLDHSNPAPFGIPSPISEDYDGDLRCDVMPTVGADETQNTSGDNFKAITGTKFTGQSKTYIGYPAVFTNSASASSRLGYRWYVDGVKVSDSFHLKTIALKYPKSVVKLEAYNCAKSDTFTMTVTIDSPTVKPTSDFISDYTSVRQGETVQFTDLSTGYPSSWIWEITPKTAVVNGSLVATYQYVFGNANTDVNKVRFDVPGKYKVCLTATNAKGKGNTECKTNYIEVVPAISLTTTKQTLNHASGFIYDNGGPNGNPVFAPYYNTLPKAVIDACADSVYLVFKSFDMYCPYQYVRVYEGKDNTGKLLTCSANKFSGAYGPGLTGSASSLSCSQNCPPIRKGSSAGTFVYDTFKASKYMYIEMEANTTGSYHGFEAYYWTKPSTMQKPKASFTTADSSCVDHLASFTNTSTGSDINYLWYLDGNITDFEAISKDAQWPYFAPGKYEITLIASNCGGTDTFKKSIIVHTPKSPVSSFTADNLTPTTDDVVFFADDMPVCVAQYEWTFKASSGSGQAVFVNNTNKGSAQPNVKFTATGCYDVTLYTQNATGASTVTKSCYIKVRSPYCTPTTSNKSTDIGISEVKFNTINNTSPQGTTSYTSYVNDPAKSTTLETGAEYELTVARTTNNNKISRTAWIDWNIDGVFDTLENIGEELNSQALSWTTKVKIPTGVAEGATVMRIAVNQGAQTNSACGPNVYGEYEDYRVYVRPDFTKPVITLIGDDTVYTEQCVTYVDSGATAWDNVDGNLTSQIKPPKTTPSFNNMVTGTYVTRYSVLDASGNEGEAYRVVIVTPDKTPPVLEVYSPDTSYSEIFSGQAPDSIYAYDCIGGTLTASVSVTGFVNYNIIGVYTLSYEVTDAAGNAAVETRVKIVHDKTEPVIVLLGDPTVTHEVGTPYTDAGVSLLDNYYPDSVLRSMLQVHSNVDVNKLDTYTVVYTLTDPSGNGPVTVTRTVVIVDTKPPVISIIGGNPYTMEVNTQFTDPGIKIADNYDLITAWDTSGTFYLAFASGFANRTGTYIIVYTVTDESGNKSSVSRTVIVKDTKAPLVTLIGDAEVTLCRWEHYTDPGAIVNDNHDASVDLILYQEGSFLAKWTQIPGLWSMRYKVTDKSGNTGYSEWRSIRVLEAGTDKCATSIIDQDADRYISVYPNPSSGRFTVNIRLPETEAVKIKVTDLLGQEIQVPVQGTMTRDILELDMSGRASGIYMLVIQAGTKTYVKRLVISR